MIMNIINSNLQNALKQIQGVHPLLHCISNIVTANDCANLALAIGASPIMAQEPQEASDRRSCKGSRPKHRNS